MQTDADESWAENNQNLIDQVSCAANPINITLDVPSLASGRDAATKEICRR